MRLLRCCAPRNDKNFIVIEEPRTCPRRPSNPARASLPRFVERLDAEIVDRDAPVDAVFLGRVVAGRLVVRAAIVPDHDVGPAPPAGGLAAGGGRPAWSLSS